jgi:GntR family transcriptional regulator, transcriptional repressor for pyruvate dehydrogenase complex
MTEDIDSSSLVRQAIKAVSEYIRDNNLRVGDSIPGEMDFANHLGVSRPVVREAFGAMSALRLIDVKSGRKPKISAFDGAVMEAAIDHAVMTEQLSIADIWEVRQHIELRTAALAAQRRSDDEAEKILALAQAMVEARDDRLKLTELDKSFHMVIAEASHNLLYIHIVRSFGSKFAQTYPHAWRTRKTVAEVDAALRHHQRIAEAIARGDAQKASIRMFAHFDEVEVEDLLSATD